MVLGTLPLMAGIFYTLMHGRSRSRKAMVTGTFAENVLIAAIGGAVLVLCGWMFGDVVTPVVMALVGWAALGGRVALRSLAVRQEQW